MRRSLLWGIAVLMVLAVGVFGSLGGDTSSAARWGADYFPNLRLVTHEGKDVRFYEDLIKGKIVVINFIYANCPDICPLSSARMAKVYEWLGDRVGRDIFIYSITLDPEHDTPDVLNQYAAAFGAGPGWVFLTGRPEDVHAIRWKLGERSRTLSEHRSDMVVGNDATGFWRRTSLMGNLTVVTEDILAMDPQWQARRRPIPADSLVKTREDYLVHQDHPGEALFLKACSFCHTIGEGDRVGPDLQGVTARRDRAWLIRFLMDPEALRARKDPIAADLDARYSVKMPYLDLSEADATDIIAYLETEEKRVRAETAPAELAPGHSHNHDHHEHNHGHGTEAGKASSVSEADSGFARFSDES